MLFMSRPGCGLGGLRGKLRWIHFSGGLGRRELGMGGLMSISVGIN